MVTMVGMCIVLLVIVTGRTMLYPNISEVKVALQGAGISLIGSVIYQNSINLNVFQTMTEQKSRIIILAVIFYIIFWLLRSLLPENVASFLFTLLVITMSLGNKLKFDSRNEPIIWSDLTGGLSLIKSVIVDMLIDKHKGLFYLGMILLICVIILLTYLGNDKKTRKNRSIILVITLLSLAVFLKNTNILLQKAGARIYPNNIEENLKVNGPGLYFFFTKEGTIMAEPEGYSQVEMKDLVSRFNELYKEKAVESKNSNQKPTYIYVLSEAFTDPTLFQPTEWKEDPMPYIRSLQKKSGGYMYSNIFGGGTANTEYSILSNFSHELLNSGSLPYAYINENPERAFSIVEERRSEGYETVAIHPSAGTNYNRNNVFKSFGIESFIEESKGLALVPSTYFSEGWYSDDSFYTQVLSSLTDAPQLLHTISMQNHFPYDKKRKGELKEEENRLINKDKLASGTELATYARGITKTDNATKSFLEALEKEKKDIYVIFYGDHLPAMSDELYQDTTLSSNDNQTVAKQLTTYFIWNNKGEQVTTPNVVNPEFMTLQAAASANQLTTVFQQFLFEVSQQVSAFDLQTGTGFAENKEIKLSNLTDKQKQSIKDYQLLMYDMLSGKQYAKSLFQ